jgi:hypothetical protein
LALERAGGAEVDRLAATTVVGGLEQVDPRVVRDALAAKFGIVRGEPVRVIVMNGVRRGWVPEAVADELIAAGYRVSAFGPARGSNHKTTVVYASSEDAVPHAEAIRDALGTGRVMLSRIPSGLGDVTIVTGKDIART